MNVRNVNGTAAVAAVAEVAQVTFGALTAGQTLILAGRTITAGGAGATAADVATAFATGTTTGGATVSGTITGYTAAAGDNATAVKFTSTVAGNVVDLANTGTGAIVGATYTQGVTGVASTGVVDTIAAGNFAGATEFNSVNSLNGVTFTGLATGASVGQVGNGSITNGALSFAYATPTADVTLNISGGTRGANTITNTGAGATTVTINSTGAANTVGAVQLAGGATVKTLTINAESNLTTGAISNLATDAAVTVKGSATSVNVGTLTAAKTIDASGLAGGVTATLDTVVTSFKGGAGNDTVTSAALATNTAGVVDAGAGTADVLVVANSLTVDTATEAANYVNFEVLRNSHNTDLDASLISGITSLQVAGADAGFVKMSAGQAANIVVQASNATNTFALTTATGTADVLGFTLQNATAAAVATPIDLTAATVTGFETIKVVSSSGTKGGAASAGNDLSFAAAENVGEILVSGEYDLTVNTANLIKAVTITSGQSSTGNLNVTGALVKGSVVTTSANADSITTTGAVTGGAGDFVTYNAGAGNDAISSTVAAINNTSAANASVKIDGGVGTDTLTITDAGGFSAVDANFQYLTNIEAITYAVANQAVNVTTGGFFDANFKAAGAKLTLGDATNAQVNSVDLTTFTGNANVALNASAATTQAQTIKTGAGTDTVALTASALTTGGFTIATGAGNDTIAVTVTTALDTTVSTINGGAGKDAVTLSGVVAADTALVSIVTNAGQSTLAAFDVVTGGAASNGTVAGTLLNFDGSAVAAANVTSGAVTGYTSGELTYTVANGLMTFAGSAAAALTAATKATLAQTVITAANATVAFVQEGNTYVFHNDAAGDSLVELVGVTALGLGAGSTTTGYVNVG